MAFNIAFYVHHHGSGHLMRSLQVANKLKDYHITLFGSSLHNLSDIGDNTDVVHLPLDVEQADNNISLQQRELSTLHYAPILISGIRERAAIITNAFKNLYPLILVVDVSVEITMLARLSGIPTIVIMQHGKRVDFAHLSAYESAEKLIAPFSEDMYNGENGWVKNKTVFTGGFSRFDGRMPVVKVIKKKIAILIGAGGTSIDSNVVNHIALQCKSFEFHVFGEVYHPDQKPVNVTYHRYCSDPFDEISSSYIIIGNTGHNTVMEVASLNKRFVGIPEPRPFFEQDDKALSITGRAGIEILAPEEIFNKNWFSFLNDLSVSDVDWTGIIKDNAIDNFACTIIETASALFKSKSF